MKTIEYTTRDKSNWGEGPWMDEPDKIQFEDPETGLPCMIVRNHGGALCGYVGVGESHPAFNKPYDEVDVSVHGGLTYSDFCMEDVEQDHAICHIVEDGENDRVWWLGFDCNHWNDFAPGMDAELQILFEMSNRDYQQIEKPSQYKNINYVKNEIKELAKQLKAMQ